jgi:hypothetical protein
LFNRTYRRMFTTNETILEGLMMTSRKQGGDESKMAEKPYPKKPISMHEGIPVWYDCCSCEAEPYWLEAMAVELPDQKDSKRRT